MPKGDNARPAYIPDEFDIIAGRIAVLLRSGYRDKASRAFKEGVELSKEMKRTADLRGHEKGRPCKTQH